MIIQTLPIMYVPSCTHPHHLHLIAHIITRSLLQLLAMKRVGVLHGGMRQGLDDKVVPPSQRLKIARYNELSSPYASSTAYSDGEGMMG